MLTVFCRACRKAIEPSDIFCKSCGADQRPNSSPSSRSTVVQPPLPQIAESTQPVLLQCPNCNGDQVQKVSGLFNAGAWSSNTQGSFGGVIATGNGHLTPFGGTTVAQQQGASGLARLLAPPATAKYKKPVTVDILMFLIPTFLLTSFIHYLIDKSDPAWSREAYAPFLQWTPYLSAIGILVLAYPAWKQTEERREEHEAEKALRQHRMKSWNELYYCGRCDRVYDPRSRRSVPTSDMASLLS